MSAAQEHQEIIIIKRGHDDHDDHHGGAWKIAFADFMTAMFCLFLVLWLVNAANEETKQAVASYFNPVKLVDRNRSVKGLYDAQGIQEVEVIAEDGSGKAGSGETDAAGGGQAEEAGTPTGDAAFFADPYEALDEIASTFEEGQTSEGAPMSGFPSWSPEETEIATDNFFDPFAPERWTEMPREPLSDAPLSDIGQPPVPGGPGLSEDVTPAESTAQTDVITDQAAQELAEVQADPPARPQNAGPAPEEVTEVSEVSEAAEVSEAVEVPETEVVDVEPVEQPDDIEQAADQDPEEPAEPSAAARQEAEQLRAELTDALTEAFGEGSVLVEQLTVEALPDAILISLTDNLQIPMFEIGSAIPSPPLVVALEGVGGVIGARTGGIRVEGHTDARQFAAGTSDNWQLSSARAQAAYYMLVRGGVPENRFRAVTGKADRDLADPDDPLNARNRRIDILLEPSER